MSDEHVVEQLLDAITSKYDEEYVLNIIDETITDEYSDFDPEEFVDEFENYYATGNNEIPQNVIEELIRVESESLGIDISSDEEEYIINQLADEWDIEL